MSRWPVGWRPEKIIGRLMWIGGTEIMASIGEKQAIRLYKSEWWKGLSARQIVKFQLFVDELCMPWSEYHSAVEDALGRDVYTQEFGSSGVGQLQAEFRGDASAPTLQEIIELLPADKRIVVRAD
jgi:hypothetical protein